MSRQKEIDLAISYLEDGAVNTALDILKKLVGEK